MFLGLQWFSKRRKKALLDALENVKSGTLRRFFHKFVLLFHFLNRLGSHHLRVKLEFDGGLQTCAELMTLGFISLLLSVTGRYISRICIPVGAADTMLPCSLRRSSSEQEVPGGGGHVRRHLSGDPTNFKCAKVSNFLCATSSHFCRGRNCFCSSVQLYMPQSEQFLCARSSHLFSGRSRF